MLPSVALTLGMRKAIYPSTACTKCEMLIKRLDSQIKVTQSTYLYFLAVQIKSRRG